MRAQDLADAAVGDMGDEEPDEGDADGDMELEALMTRFARATAARDARAMAAAFRQAMEACG
jgi:hypothetical protein